MRYARSAALAGVALLLLALGPVVLLLAGLLLLEPVRRWLRPSTRVLLAVGATVAVVVGLTVLVPDGRLPIPPGVGALTTPSYVGRPAFPRALDVADPRTGPVGESPEVDTAWYGAHRCTPLLLDARDRLVGRCRDRSGDRIRVIDPETLRPLTSKPLGSGEDLPDPDEPCGLPAPVLDPAGLLVVPTADRRVLRVATHDADGEPDLTTAAAHDLSAVVPADDCVVGVDVDRRGVTWVVTRAGLVVLLRGAADAEPGVLDLAELVANPPTAGGGAVFVVTDEAVHRLGVGAGGRPVATWRSEYDRGARTKPGQPSRGSGTAATLLAGGVVVTADNAVPRMHVELRDATDGGLVCRTPVFGDDASATATATVPVGPTAVVVVNHHGASRWLDNHLGRTSDAGVARVDLVDGECVVRWTAEVAAPGTTPAVAGPDGLVHVVTKRSSRWAVDAWYLTALDARTGRRAFEARTGTGALHDARGAGVTLGPDGAAYLPVRGGVVRVRDRVRDSP